ncbi:SGNH/GDSL hydrolase family protein [Marinobacter sp. X15-166B]|uniref:SGNH/GDSL hydrolase family protein n=1 Tax=Marinobacter sp. X15-166B TaxID=1897620 RepID=UPI00085C294C|nr:SGNH/GDSL hydrolase family protein [Marinobacter sp. X15-166B]OEY66955.1 hypothetical protein BG841_11150 [Marinobacter sp. X15-166B]
MLHTVLSIPLAPLLLLQGKRVRATTPALPEPTGARRGKVGQGPALNLLMLGDSAAAGVGVSAQEQALSGQLTRRLSDVFTVTWTLQAQTGLRVADYLPPHDRLPAVSVDVLVLSLGVNDLTSGVSMRRWRQRTGRLLDILDQRYSPRLILFTAVPPVHRFPALPQPLRWYLGQRAHKLNRQLADIIAPRSNTKLVTIAFEATPESMAVDGFHPGPGGYHCWADALARIILANHLTKKRGSPTRS